MSTTNQFQLSIGAKRQLTLPSELLDQLQVPDRGQLLIQVVGDHAVITPMVIVPRTHLPEELRRTFESRRGAERSDIPLAQFLNEIGYQANRPEAPEMLALARRSSTPERVQSIQELTPNEAAALQKGEARGLVKRARKASPAPALTAQAAARAQRGPAQRKAQPVAPARKKTSSR